MSEGDLRSALGISSGRLQSKKDQGTRLVLLSQRKNKVKNSKNKRSYPQLTKTTALFLITSTFRASYQDAFRIRTDDSQQQELTWVQRLKNFRPQMLHAAPPAGLPLPKNLGDPARLIGSGSGAVSHLVSSCTVFSGTASECRVSEALDNLGTGQSASSHSLTFRDALLGERDSDCLLRLRNGREFAVLHEIT